MKRAALALLAGAGLMLVGAGIKSLGKPSLAREGQSAPEFTLPDLVGQTRALADFRGKVVLLTFWATWCQSCQEEMPHLQRLQEEQGGKGFSVVSISVDEDGRKAVAPFVERYRLTYPVLISDNRSMAKYSVYGLPAAFLIDARGVIVARYIGPVDPQRLENDIVSQLDKRRS